MNAIPASVIIVSRHRTQALLRCLTGLAQSDHPQFEVIVVADPAACVAVRAAGWTVKIAEYDVANISGARNIGLGMASAPVVAFVDDDAVPEPTWLGRLTAPFADNQVVQAGGFVRGRNGISFQWKAVLVNAEGVDHPLKVDAAAVSLHSGSKQYAVKTQGTNCAFRRDTLLAAGGFDESLWFYLDEADVNLRLAGQGLTAVVPLAQVHHGFEASARRRGDRVPTSLHEIGASTAVFLRRHTAVGRHDAVLARLRDEQRARLLRLMVAGLIEPRDVRRMLATLDAGIADGAQRALAPMAALAKTATAFLALPGTGPRAGRVIAGTIWQRAALLAKARAAAAAGDVVTVFVFSRSAVYHRHSFQAEGFWLQSGGVYGKAERHEPLFRRWGITARIALEARRLAALRPL
ncbi:MAG: glycosyltransferase [Paracoccaceae bacterium]